MTCNSTLFRKQLRPALCLVNLDHIMPSTTRYAPLPNPQFAQDAEREMEDAFDLTNELDIETTPLTRNLDPDVQASSSSQQQQISTYDFEREYDFPPPGSPPSPSAQARPNDYGNSNGLLPASPIDRPQQRMTWYRRILGAVLPSQYQPVATESHRLGGGNDGVFANVVAKPQPARTMRTDDGEVIVIPEESQKDTPPVCFKSTFWFYILITHCL
jgi:hypothetical protein